MISRRAVWVFYQLFIGGPGTVCMDAADFNNDSAIDISDVVGLLWHQFLGGPPPAPPYPACGREPEGLEDGLDSRGGNAHCF